MLTTRKGYSLTSQERIAKEVIERLMCNYRLNWNEIATTMQISVEEVKAALHYDQTQLNEMAADGLFDMTESGIVMTTTGHPFVRNVAAALDPLMQNTDKKFSKPI
jgi:oxygen-independent coproporphyrinogen-3 oxidase